MQLSPVRRSNPPSGVTDLAGLKCVFNKSTGDYEVTVSASSANPFEGWVRVNIHLFNADTGTTAQNPSFFASELNDRFVASPTTIVTLSGRDQRLTAWKLGDRVAACQGEGFEELGPCLGGLGLPAGIAGFSTGVINFPAPPPFPNIPVGLDDFQTSPPAIVTSP